MSLKILFSVLSIFGASGIVGAFFTYYWQKRKDVPPARDWTQDWA
jgi:hypothetical protein